MRLRKRWLEIDRRQRGFHECPVCKRMSVKRIASGIWGCRRCGAKFTGGAYTPYTDAARAVERVIKKVRENV
jgi:large subunit ribosomal protein L37Ae